MESYNFTSRLKSRTCKKSKRRTNTKHRKRTKKVVYYFTNSTNIQEIETIIHGDIEEEVENIFEIEIDTDDEDDEDYTL